MAAIVDWQFDYPLPIETFLLAAYNKYQISITSDSGVVYHHKFRIALTLGGYSQVKDVDPISGAITLNPFISVRDWLSVDEPLGLILIEIGEVYANLEDEPPTFRGYDESKTILFYNGYDYTEDVNHVDGGWEIRPSEPTQQFKVPVVKGTLPSYAKIGESDEFILGGFSTIGQKSAFTYSYSITGIAGEFLDINGNVVGVFNEALTPDDYTMVHFNIGTYLSTIVYPSNWHTMSVWWVYTQDNGVDRPFDATTKAFFIKETCPTYKYDRFRLRWFNRYSTYEYQNFWMKSKYTMIWDEGKELFTDGIDRPQLIRIGKSGTTEYELNSDWLSEDEQLALREMYESPRVAMFDPDNVEYDVIILDNSYEVTDLKDGLFKVKVRLKLARMNKSRLQ